MTRKSAREALAERNRRAERIADGDPGTIADAFTRVRVGEDEVLSLAPADAAALCKTLKTTPAGGGLSLLTVIVEAAGLGEQRPPNLRADAILPAKLAHVSPNADKASLALFSTAAVPVQGTLPKLDIDPTGPALPLALYDLENRAGRGRSPAASMALRLFVESVLTVMQRDFVRASHAPVALSVPLREFLNWFYGDRQPRPTEYWPVLNRAVDALDRNEARLEWFDPVTGHGGRRRIVTVSDIPRGAGRLDDLVTLTVFLPPGTRTGPAINRPRLRHWGRKSEAAYRAMLGLAYRWFRPGVTRIPANRRRSHWLQVQDPQRYPPLTETQAIALCFPASNDSNRRRVAAKAWETLQILARAGDMRMVGRRPLPPA